MTLFTGKSPAGNVEDKPDQGEVDYVAHYTKDGKAPDLSEIAKGKYHADQHIARLEQEQANLRKELDKRLTYEEVIAKIEAAKTSSKPVARVEENADEHANEKPHTPSNELDLSKVEELMRKTYQQESVKAQQAKNIEQIKDTLVKSWGAGYERALSQKAEELGLSKEYMDNLAASSPKAFLALVGVQDTPRANPSSSLPPQSRVEGRPGSNDRSGVKNMAYYNKLMQTDPREYWTPRVQNEIHEQARIQGDAFYK